MFRNALFQVGCCQFTLPIRNNEIRRIELDYGAKFVRWLETQTKELSNVEREDRIPGDHVATYR